MLQPGGWQATESREGKLFIFTVTTGRFSDDVTGIRTLFAILVSIGAFAQPLATKLITEADCTAAKLGAAIPVSAIGLPVSAVTLNAPEWRAEANGSNPAYCNIQGAMTPVDKWFHRETDSLLGVAMPASWSLRAAQLGGGGMNGSIPGLTGGLGRGGGVSLLSRGFVTYGSDSGHQSGGRGGPPSSNDWATNDEAIANLGYMQLKKTHDAAMVLMERAFGERPRFRAISSAPPRAVVKR